jgi:nucleotide-binding universal stress UspA family protein
MATKTILYATDFSASSRRALAVAGSLARDPGGRLLVLHVVPNREAIRDAELAAGIPPSEHFDADMTAYRSEMKSQLDALEPLPGITVERLLKEGHVVPTILRTAEERACDLIVLGTHGKNRIQRALMGSVAEQVMRQASCPVVIVKQPSAPRPTG